MRILISAVVLVSLVACGKSDKDKEAPATTGSAAAAPKEHTSAAAPATPPAGGKKACGYLSEEDASSIMGQPMKHKNDYEDSCEILPANQADDGPPGMSIMLNIDAKSTSTYDYMNGQASPTKAPVDGVGDRAVLDHAMPGLVQIAVAKGSRSFLITLTDPTLLGKPPADSAKLGPMAKAAAAKVASKL